MKKTMTRAGAAMLFAASLLAFQGCRNALQSPDVPGGDGTGGAITLRIGDARGRAILPDVNMGMFERFDVVLELQGSGDSDTIPLVGTDTVTLDNLAAGLWNIEVRAFLDEFDDPDDYVAFSSTLGILVNPGLTTTVAVELELLLDGGTGTFRWDIDVNQNVTITFAEMEIVDEADIAVDTITLWNNFANYNTMDAGEYDVTIVMTNSEGETVTIGPQILRVYRGFESVLEMTISMEHFPTTALNHILHSWNGNEWDFAARGVTWAFFEFAGIEGVTDANFGAMTALFDDLASEFGEPDDLDTMREMVDIAWLEWYDGFSLGGHADEAAFVAALYGLAPNSAYTNVTLSIAGVTDDGVTASAVVEAGIYSFTAQAPLLAGTVGIIGDLYVGDTIEADLTTVTGYAGTQIFQWLRGGTLLVGTDQEYDLMLDDVGATITLRVTFTGSFGYVEATTLMISAEPGGMTITIGLREIYVNPMTDISPPPFPFNQDSPLVTLNGAATGITWWYGGDEVGNEADFTLTQAMHGGRLGTHVVTVRATINGQLYTLNLNFVVELP
jgi:hypothetical protein